jgi:serine/threonine protein kinase/Tol biopolymer transport system component
MSPNLSPGARLGRYEIKNQLGAGAMGEVYLAQDTRLHRKIALKVLPSELTQNKDRLRRFEQEARAAAGLNHPNICHVYEIDEIDGQHFITMEFVDGSTLRAKIHREGTELRKLLRYLQHVAEGLAKAHAAGIVHRDLKPDNIMISREGHAKILDFGLAKLIEQKSSTVASQTTGQAISEAATVAYEQYSQPGTVLGTAGYMSPEQAQGKTAEIDHRSDIFSFGCVLFEAVTRHRPFESDSKVKTLYKIVYEPAPLITDFKPSAPPELQRIIRRCLAKDVDDRYQTIKDVAIELKELRRELDRDAPLDITVPPSSVGSEVTTAQSDPRSSDPTMATSVTHESSPTSSISSAEFIVRGIKQHRNGLALALAGLLLVVGATFFIWYKFLSTNPRNEPFRAMRINRLTTGGKIGSALIKGYTSISPDGKYVVFRTTEGGRDSLVGRQVLTGSVVRIVSDVEGKIGGTTFSRDGEFIYYSLFDKDNPLGVLYQVAALGGTPRRVIGGVTSPVTFSPDNKQLAFVRASATESDLLVAGLDGSGERKIASRKLPDYFSLAGGPAWSPDGKTIACGAGTFSGNLSGTIIEVPVAGGPEKPITSQNWVSVSRALWLSDGSGLIVLAVPELISAGTQIWYVSYPDGETRRITNDLNGYGTSSLGLTADSKTLVTVQADKSAQIWAMGPGEDESRAKQITSGKYDGDSIALAPDGGILYTTVGEHSDIWIVRADGAENKQLTADAYTEELGCVSLDGRYVVFSSNRSGNFNLWRMELNGNNPKQLTEGTAIDSQPTCSPDGQWVLFRSLRQGKPTFWKVPMTGGRPEQLSDKSSSWAAVSPDGKLIALRYFDEQAQANKLAVMPFAGGEPIKTFDISFNFRDVGLGWTSDSRSIIYADARDNADNIWSLPLDSGPAKQLTNFKSGLIFAFEISREGNQIVLSRGSQMDDVILLRDSQ